MRIVGFARVPLAIVAIAISSSGAAGATGWEENWSSARPLALDGTVPLDDLEVGQGTLVSLEVPAPGLLAVEVNVSGLETTSPWIDFLPTACSEPNAGNRPVRYLERSPRRQMLVISEAGTYHLRIGTLTPDQLPAAYQLSTHFLDTGQYQKDADGWGAPAVKDGEDASESCMLARFPDGRIVWSGPPPAWGTGAGIAKDGEGEGDGDDTEESDNEILPLIIEIPGPPPAWCAEREPLNDLSFFARRLPMGGSTVGELRNEWCDDHDYFAFTLSRTSEIRAFTTGTTDTFGSLYDELGHRLLAADGGGADENFALSAVLTPGQYFIRVEGTFGAEGGYQLTLSGSEL